MISLATSAILLSSILAWAWAKSRGWLGYVISTLGLWAAVSAALSFRVDLAHFLAALISFAPLALLPGLFLVPLVVTGAKARTILVVSTVTSISALAPSYFNALYASCYLLHDCP